MEAKWPFILILFFFLGLTGYIISQLERSKVMKDWDKRRCDLTVMMAARFFKPDMDSRTPEQFSNDNFEFCVKQFTDSFMNIATAPVVALLGKQADLTGGAIQSLQQVREVVKRVTDAFMSYLSSYWKKFQSGMFEFRRIIAYLRQSIGRLMAIVTSTIYIGLTMFRGMMSSIQVVIRVVLIICVIMIAVIIILWFILLPVIPFILTTLTAVVSLVVALSVVMSGSLASEAEDKKSGFCFAEHTILCIKRPSMSTLPFMVPIRMVQIDDRIVGEDKSEHRITAVMKMTSKDVNWYHIDGIYVAGDHMIQKEDGNWIYVKDDPRAVKQHSSVSIYSPFVYCLNTESHVIPIHGKTEDFHFRDWEELEESDEEGHRLWRKSIDEMLNGVSEFDSESQSIPLVGRDTEVWSPMGPIRICELKVGDMIYDGRDQIQEVLGVVQGEAIGEASDGMWYQGGWSKRKEGDRWEMRKDSIRESEKKEKGWNLITETGEWVCFDNRERITDFTEVGHVRIRELYRLVSARLSGLSLQ